MFCVTPSFSIAVPLTLKDDLDALPRNHDHSGVDTGKETSVGVLNNTELTVLDTKGNLLKSLTVGIAKEAKGIERCNTTA